MKYASSKLFRFLRDRSGVTSFEILLVFFSLFFIFLATADLARFFLTVHSVRTVVNEMARQALVYCTTSSASRTAACSLPSANISTAEAMVSLSSGDWVSSGTSAQRSAVDSTGAFLITASAAYNFDFMVVPWKGTRTQISQTVSLAY